MNGRRGARKRPTLRGDRLHVQLGANQKLLVSATQTKWGRELTAYVEQHGKFPTGRLEVACAEVSAVAGALRRMPKKNRAAHTLATKLRRISKGTNTARNPLTKRETAEVRQRQAYRKRLATKSLRTAAQLEVWKDHAGAQAMRESAKRLGFAEDAYKDVADDFGAGARDRQPLSKRRGNPIRLTAGDKRAIEVFTDGEGFAEGKLLRSNGGSLEKMGIGGGTVAKWHGGKIHIDPSRPHVKSDETIIRALRKATPAKWFAKTKPKAKRKRKKNPVPLAIVVGNPKAKQQARLERLWNKFHGQDSRNGEGPTFRRVKATGSGTLHLMEVGGAKELKIKGYAQLALRGYKAYATDDGRKLILARSLTHVGADTERLGAAQFVTYSGPAYSDSKRGVWWKHKFGPGVNVYRTEVGNVYVIYGGNFGVSDWLRD